jgi:hypothetical protein
MKNSILWKAYFNVGASQFYNFHQQIFRELPIQLIWSEIDILPAQQLHVNLDERLVWEAHNAVRVGPWNLEKAESTEPQREQVFLYHFWMFKLKNRGITIDEDWIEIILPILPVPSQIKSINPSFF